MFTTPQTVDLDTLPAHFQMECIELQPDIQLRSLTMSLYQTSISPVLAEKYPLLHSQALFMTLLFGSMHICEQLSRMKYRKSKISSEISDEHLESSQRFVTPAFEPA